MAQDKKATIAEQPQTVSAEVATAFGTSPRSPPDCARVRLFDIIGFGESATLMTLISDWPHMTARYYSDAPIRDDRVILNGDEAHHLLKVMRLKAGERVVLFDGSGFEFDSEIITCERHSVELAVVERREVDRELPWRVVLGVALPKGNRQKWLIEKLTELGVSELVPLETDRSVAQPDHAAIQRLRRTVIEASKQCGRNRLMKIAPAQAFANFIDEAAIDPSAQRLIAHPGGKELGARSSESGVIGAVGPEGGFTDKEVAAALASRWKTVSLGPRTLRVETAAIALAAQAGAT